MNTDVSSNATDRDDDPGIERLLREVGARAEPSAEVAAAVRAIVQAEWQATVTRRRRRKVVTIGVSLAASAVLAVAGIALFGRYSSTRIAPQTVIASIARIQGDAPNGFAEVSTNSGENWRDVRAGEKLTTGSVLRTGAAVRVALDFGSGLSVRIDGGTLLRLTAADQATLESGRLYVDALPPQHVRWLVRTRLGALEHLGTQYQAQLAGEKLTVSVREGRVAISVGDDSLRVTNNERLVVTSHGEVVRQAVASDDASWHWAAQVAVPFVIENRSLSSFLEWVARETGRNVRYSSPEVRQQAEQLILRGSIGDLSPEQALAAVLATTQFTHKTNAAVIDIHL